MLAVILILSTLLLPRGLGGVCTFFTLNTLSGGIPEIAAVVIAEAFNGARGSNISYIMAKLLSLISGIILVACGFTSFKTPFAFQVVAIGFFIYIWGNIIAQASNKLVSIVIAVVLTVASLMTTNQGSQSMIILSLALFALPQSLSYLVYGSKTMAEDTQEGEYLAPDGIVPGLLSGLLWATPTAALIKAAGGDKPTKETAEGITSGLALLLALTNSGSRSATSDSITRLAVSLEGYQVITILVISAITTVLFYSTKKEQEDNKVFQKLPYTLTIIGSVAITIALAGSYGFFLCLVGLLVTKLIRVSSSPRELLLLAPAIPALVNLLPI